MLQEEALKQLGVEETILNSFVDNKEIYAMWHDILPERLKQIRFMERQEKKGRKANKPPPTYIEALVEVYVSPMTDEDRKIRKRIINTALWLYLPEKHDISINIDHRQLAENYLQQELRTYRESLL